ncbi:hypothetical protein NJ7G_2434 [Natrinema sp. J7-2]|nr:hypothetical protein NJ7G_2434 [Natrinema sp. J7-2]
MIIYSREGLLFSTPRRHSRAVTQWLLVTTVADPEGPSSDSAIGDRQSAA